MTRGVDSGDKTISLNPDSMSGLRRIAALDAAAQFL